MDFQCIYMQCYIGVIYSVYKEQCLASKEHLLVIKNNVWRPLSTNLSLRTMYGVQRTRTCHKVQSLASKEHLPLLVIGTKSVAQRTHTCYREQCLESIEHLLVTENNVWSP